MTDQITALMMIVIIAMNKGAVAVFDDIVNHVESTWDHVRHGNSTLGEKIEFTGEAVGLAVGVFAFGGFGLSRCLTGSAEAVLPKLALTGNRAATEISLAGHDLAAEVVGSVPAKLADVPQIMESGVSKNHLRALSNGPCLKVQERQP